uniref:HTH cro/C1-type domain-containing protein n=1 Tax=Skeletonema marinoi TaxID=267567 RepID=A0A6U3TVK3_9STRA|eukprot:CAMPEP_0113376764 /NCGR_PEP_ID=MMETSP0013_2-20120614/2800_1 /TAXON_ID=2843 ORGANISM="Skeletonema costatum, Strain 1716" /NCGR_SAMPLE_ID=MMETSP0013_2 /ASSEMBLY_ACC=CAM_ASM_000158 /LENGTH=168 /DNA_ID=CAMNT_0000258861 /DNA_START=80 /DNA_END=586 /DNA_ORIENTATION=+ /assembly_acc=CAM_ASM_000158
MPNTNIQTGQDWGAVNVGRSSAGRVAVPKTAHGVTRAKAMGLLATEKKFGAGGNRSAHTASVNAKKIEDSDELKLNKVDKSLSKAIQQARMAKKMTQKDLATRINEKPQVVGEYESGKAVPNGQIIVKMERVLGVKLPRPGKKPAAKLSAAEGAKKGGVVRGGPPKRR